MIGGGVKRQHLYAWEVKGNIPSIPSLLQIANACGLQSIDLFFVSDYSSSNNNDNRGKGESSNHTKQDSEAQEKLQASTVS